jgi:formate hydrogenlyase subunit 6/NADH:ubiquinone oxidoreductase subunit I
MAGITLDAGKCVRALSKFSVCDHCVSVCPTDALQTSEMVPSLNLSQCVGCGGCAGICPTEAIAVDGFNTTEFFFAFASSEENLLSCRKNLPCIASLNVEHVIALAGLKGDVVFDMGHCDRCEIADTCRPRIEALADEANYLLQGMEQSATVRLEMVSFVNEEAVETSTDRRDFFKKINIKDAAVAKQNFDREVETATDERIEHSVDNAHISQLRQKNIPDKRKLFFTALKRMEKPQTFHVVDASEVSFTSQKLLDVEHCTACQMCYRLCPTGALTSDKKNSKIDFDPFLCIKCHLCHDVCEPDCLTLSGAYNLKEMFEPQVQNLATFNVRNCYECNVPFVSIGEEKLCYRCKIEEEEARELWGINEKY